MSCVKRVWAYSRCLFTLIGYEQAEVGRRMVRFANEEIAVGAQAARDALATNPDAAARAVLVVDAYLHLPAGRLDASDAFLQWEPLEVIVEMARDETVRTVGGSPQVVRIYQYGESEAFVWRTAEADYLGGYGEVARP